MAVTYFGGTSNAIASAYGALQSEEAELVRNMEAIRGRLNAVRNAMTAMKPLLPEGPYSGAADDADEAEEQATGSNPFSGLTFSKALYQFLTMMGGPMTPPEIARLFEASGWQFSNPQTTHKTNQVGVTLRRFRGKLFEQDSEGRWYALAPAHGLV